MHAVLINGEWRNARSPTATFRAANPATGETLRGEYPVSNWADIEVMLDAAVAAAESMFEQDPAHVAAFLRAFADHIDSRAQELAESAHAETSLPVSPRLADVEIPRTTNQLRLAAAAAESDAWRQPVVDSDAGLASVFGPLGGPVVVFGPNNFPFAFNAVSGGDFAAAIAAHNPVIAKAHPLHPSTSRRLAELAREALSQTSLHPAAVQFFYHMQPQDGLRLVADHRVGATAFTGSRTAGLTLMRAASEAGRPIYLEMSGVNPVFVLPGAVRDRADAVVSDYVDSCTLGVGQFCTKPGLLILIKSETSDRLVAALSERVSQAPVGVMLSNDLAARAADAVGSLLENGARMLSVDRREQGAGAHFAPLLLGCSGESFLERPRELQREAFGPIGMVVSARDFEQLLQIARSLEGTLAATVYSAADGSDEDWYGHLAAILRSRCGRLLNDKMPTGVAVSPAMNHGGPYPATGHPGFTAVGIPASIRRFAALHSYDHVGPDRLPPSLGNLIRGAASTHGLS